jgi:N-methylhydantoinase A
MLVTSSHGADECEPADWKVGVDIGGTFIDFCALDTRSGRIVSLKVLTTPDDPGAELVTGLERLAQQEGLASASISRFVHGTTIGINTIIQRKGVDLALITNAGFEDVIELARLRMPDMYSLFCARPAPLIPRDLVFGIAARMRPNGSEATAPDLSALVDVLATARSRGAKGVVVSLLHSWRSQQHEVAVRREINRLAPDLFVFTSAEVWPVIREYERTSTAILNGYVYPRVSDYLTALEARLAERGVPTRPMLTKSNGGLMNAAEGKRSCVNMLLSGTASGVIGAAWLARQAGEQRVLTLDIGGTSADFALIVDGKAQFGTGELIGEFPLFIPSVSVSSIGIGGGSIASVDGHGVLNVGPESAGSTPGPACYGRGGTRPTVTDAMVVCGWLGHSQMAYGQLSLDVARARSAVASVADPLGCSVEETAQAILDIALSDMLVEVEKLASRSGVDLRDFVLMPFGGGGPMLGAFLARELGIGRVMVPHRPGVVSALGGLVADLRGDFIRTVFAPLTAESLPQLAKACAVLQAEGLAWLTAQGHEGPAELRISADMRYAGQSFEIEVPVMLDWLHAVDPAHIAAAFNAEHARVYDFEDPDGHVEIINLRLAAIGAGLVLNLPPAAETRAEAEVDRMLRIYSDGKIADVPLYNRDHLSAGSYFAGPAVVTQEDTTFAIPSGGRAHVDCYGNIQLSFAEERHV